MRVNPTVKKWAMQIGICLGSAAVSYGLMSTVLPAWLVLLWFGTQLAHELGHYFMALSLGQDPWLPYFLFLFFIFDTGVFVAKNDLGARQRIALAGPLVGLIACLIALGGFWIFGFMPGVWASLWLAVFNIYAGTLGSDARRAARAAKATAEI